MKLRLDEHVASSQDFTAIVLEIRAYARWYSHDAIKKRVSSPRTADTPALSQTAAELIREWSNKNSLSSKSLDELITALEEYKNTAPCITIVLAAPPPNGLKKTLVAWCREHIAQNVFVNFQFNSTLLGGMIVRAGSHVFDWSFRRQILEQRQNFPEVLRRV